MYNCEIEFFDSRNTSYTKPLTSLNKYTAIKTAEKLSAVNYRYPVVIKNDNKFIKFEGGVKTEWSFDEL